MNLNNFLLSIGIKRRCSKCPVIFYGLTGRKRCDRCRQKYKKQDNAREKRRHTEAHMVFDRLWLSGFCSRQQAYGWLKDQGLPEHISRMNSSECSELIMRVKCVYPFLFKK
jgi:hypothetical protein